MIGFKETMIIRNFLCHAYGETAGRAFEVYDLGRNCDGSVGEGTKETSVELVRLGQAFSAAVDAMDKVLEKNPRFHEMKGNTSLPASFNSIMELMTKEPEFKPDEGFDISEFIDKPADTSCDASWRKPVVIGEEK